MSHRPDWDIFSGAMYYCQQEAQRVIDMFSDVLNDIGVRLDANVADVRYIVKRVVLQLYPDRNANVPFNGFTRVDYYAAFTTIAEIIDDPLRYFFYILKLEAARILSGVPARQMPTERNTTFADARIPGDPDEFLGGANPHGVPDVSAGRTAASASTAAQGGSTPSTWERQCHAHGCCMVRAGGIFNAIGVVWSLACVWCGGSVVFCQRSPAASLPEACRR